MILVGDHAQLLAICHCHLLDIENYCQKHYVYNVIDWNFATYHTLETLIRHVEDPKYCSFFNIIHCRTPTKEEVSSILNNCYINENSRTIHWWQNNNNLHTSEGHWLLQRFDSSQEIFNWPNLCYSIVDKCKECWTHSILGEQ